MPTEAEEVVVESDFVRLEQVAPNRGEAAFGFGVGAFAIFRHDRVSGCGEGAGVDLAVRVQRHRLEHGDGGRHEIIRQLGAEVSIKLGGSRLHAVHHGDVGGEGFVGGVFPVHEHLALAHERVTAKAGFDLAKFDTEATDLYLMIDATEEEDGSIGALAAEISGSVEEFSGKSDELL